jgi:hypothetical protein
VERRLARMGKALVDAFAANIAGGLQQTRRQFWGGELGFGEGGCPLCNYTEPPLTISPDSIQGTGPVDAFFADHQRPLRTRLLRERRVAGGSGCRVAVVPETHASPSCSRRRVAAVPEIRCRWGGLKWPVALLHSSLSSNSSTGRWWPVTLVAAFLGRGGGY